MKRITYLFAGLTLAALLSPVAFAQSSDSLGDYARATRKTKKSTAKSFDNDNLPKNDTLSVVGPAPASDDEACRDKSADDEQSPGGNAKSEAKSGEPANNPASQPAADPNDEQAARQKMYEEWRNKISAQKDKIDLLTRELDVLQREYRLRAAAFYSDAGNRLRNSSNWDQEDAKYKHQIEEKQKALDAAKQQLDEIGDRARKAGVPSGMRE
jgi:hypothetical protein